MFPPERAFVRSMLVSGTPEASGGGTFSQPPPPFVSHATARTPRAHRRGPAHAAASSSFARPSPRPTLERTPGAARASRRVMRPLEESEIQQVFEKLFKFVGKNLKNIVDRADQPHCFRLHKKVRRARVRPPRPAPDKFLSRAKPPNEAAWKKTRTQSLMRKLGSERFSFARDAAVSSPPAPSSPPRPRRPTRARASQTAVMRKYPRFRTASVDEAHTILWLNFFG